MMMMIGLLVGDVQAQTALTLRVVIQIFNAHDHAPQLQNTSQGSDLGYCGREEF